jgi:hypothetical protein
VAVQGAGQQLHRGDEDAEGLGEQGDGGEEADFHAQRQELPGYEGEARGRGESEGSYACFSIWILISYHHSAQSVYQ